MGLCISSEPQDYEGIKRYDGGTLLCFSHGEGTYLYRRKWRRVQGRVEMEQKARTWCLHTCERRNVSHAKFKPQPSLFSRLS